MPLALESYAQSRRRDIESAVKTVLARPPANAPANAPALYHAQTVLKTLPAHVPSVYGLCGEPRAGKDVLAAYLQAHYAGVELYTFSDAIREEANEYLQNFSYAGRHHNIVESNKSEPHYRHLLQAWGQARRAENARHWVPGVKREIAAKLAAGARLVIATGARVDSDVEAITELGGQLVRVIRPNNSYTAEHDVERGLAHLPDSAFLTVTNDFDEELHSPEEGLRAFEANIDSALRTQV
jgi:phosphoglycolate phosphatase-like HAD superfamily hydrolase